MSLFAILVICKLTVFSATQVPMGGMDCAKIATGLGGGGGGGGLRREGGKWREPGEIENNFATFRKILQ